MEEIKLVIWDLDNTFWKGILSEGKVERVQANVETVKELASRGIICSISSKNDFDKAKRVLSEMGVWDYFVFPEINWAPKGSNVRNIIEKIKLRPQNVLFIDDNASNRYEVEYYNPGINTISEINVSSLLRKKWVQGKKDKELSRLKQYKLLERKQKESDNYGDNIDFLKHSDIQIEFIYDVHKIKDRILELINRTNQLNFTKIRISEDELNILLHDSHSKNVCIRVRDRFGDYGICGFLSYDINRNFLNHFLFSCRLLNMYIETYVYKKFGSPRINIVEPVSGQLFFNSDIDWIKEVNHIYDDTNIKHITDCKRILLVGGCDLRQMAHYIDKRRFSLICEFNHPNTKGYQIHKDHTLYFRQKYDLSDDLKMELLRLPCCDNDMFDTKVFEGDYDVLVFSVLMNYTQNIYVNKEKGYKVSCGGYKRDIRELLNKIKISQTEINGFCEEFDNIGQQSENDFLDDLNWLVDRVKKPIFFINGAEIKEIINNLEDTAYERHCRMNKILDIFVKEHSDQCKILDIRKIVDKREKCKDNIRHYNRNVYLKMAELLMSGLAGHEVKTGRLSKVFIYLQHCILKIYNRYFISYFC